MIIEDIKSRINRLHPYIFSHNDFIRKEVTEMRYFIVDDDPGVRSMLMDIIEDEGLGDIAGEAEDGAHITAELLELHKVDVLLIDLLMPQRDGIQTIRALEGRFNGKIVMISQIESKNMIGEA